MAAAIGIAHETIRTHELARPDYRRNDRFRCFHCKTELYEELPRWPPARAVLSGANADDAGDWRPGLRAAADHGVIHPLLEAAVGKPLVRALAAHLGVPSAHKPASPCLASRIPYGIPVDAPDPGPDRPRRAGGQGARVRRPARAPPRGRGAAGARVRRDLGAVLADPTRRAEVEAAVRSAGYAAAAVSDATVPVGLAQRRARRRPSDATADRSPARRRCHHGSMADPALTPSPSGPAAPVEAVRAALDDDLAALASAAPKWANLDIGDKGNLLARLHAGVAGVAAEWVRLACAAKGIGLDSPLAAEEWMSGPLGHLCYTTALGLTLDDLAAGRSPLDRGRLGRAPGGRVAVGVRMPFEAYDRLLLSGFHTDVWLEPGVSAAEARRPGGPAHARSPTAGGVALVLGAGNIASIAPLDVLYKLYRRRPRRDAEAQPGQRLPARGARAGVRPVHRRRLPADRPRRAPTVGAYLTDHALVDEVHVTGSQATHDAIVFGPGREGARRRAARSPRLAKPITSELGGVSPAIVLPGDWSEADLRFQAEHVATQRLHNGGFNCNAAQVVVLAAGLAAEGALRRPPARGALRRAGAAGLLSRGRRAPGPGAGDPPGGRAPRRGRCGRTLVAVPGQSADEAFTTEYFAPVLAVTELPDASRPRSSGAAVAFANERLYGTLSANLIADPAHPAGARGPARRADRRAALRDDRGQLLDRGRLPHAAGVWGAFPGHSLDRRRERDRASSTTRSCSTGRADRRARTVPPGAPRALCAAS